MFTVSDVLLPGVVKSTPSVAVPPVMSTATAMPPAGTVPDTRRRGMLASLAAVLSALVLADCTNSTKGRRLIWMSSRKLPTVALPLPVEMAWNPRLVDPDGPV